MRKKTFLKLLFIEVNKYIICDNDIYIDLFNNIFYIKKEFNAILFTHIMYYIKKGVNVMIYYNISIYMHFTNIY